MANSEPRLEEARRLANPDPEQPVPSAMLSGDPAASSRPSKWLLLPGFAILVACLLAGEGVKRLFGLILPGNILGLFILLALLWSGLVPLRWVEAAARWLLFLLPLLFVPIFVLALKKAVGLPQGAGFFGAVGVGVLLLWAACGHLAQRLLARPRSKEGS